MKIILATLFLIASVSGAISAGKVAVPLPVPPVPSLTASSSPLALCGKEKLKEILAPATDSSHTVRVNCRLEMKSTDRVTKQLIILGAEANGAQIKCNGATLAPSRDTNAIVVNSRQIAAAGAGLPVGKWERPENVTFTGCKILGNIRVVGVPNNNKPGVFQDSSRLAGHSERIQSSAPSHISFVSMDITSSNGTSLYIQPGSTFITLKNSILRGSVSGVAVYLDAESANNTIQNNNFMVDTTHDFDISNIAGSLSSREIIAIDSSSYNKIIGNRFSELDEGGIYLYRNCGEGGIIRHQTPNHNQIINNIFYYNKYNGDKPAIFVSSRDGTATGVRFYCDDDKGYPYGSSVNNGDFATNTVIMENRIYKFDPMSMIKIGKSGSAEIQSNTKIAVGSTTSNRHSSCYVFEEKRLYKDKEKRMSGRNSFVCKDGLWISSI